MLEPVSYTHLPVETLVKWTSPYQKLPAGSPPVTKTTLSCYLTYVLSESKNVKELGEDPEDFKPASLSLIHI